MDSLITPTGRGNTCRELSGRPDAIQAAASAPPEVIEVSAPAVLTVDIVNVYVAVIGQVSSSLPEVIDVSPHAEVIEVSAPPDVIAVSAPPDEQQAAVGSPWVVAAAVYKASFDVISPPDLITTKSNE